MTLNKKFYLRFSLFSQLLILTLVLLPAGRAAAQQQLTLDWEAARRLAMANNPSVKAARASMEEAGYSYLAVSGLNYYINYSPEINVGAARSGNSNAVTPTVTGWDAGISVSETLLNFKASSGVKISRLAKEKAESDYRSASASARQSVAAAFASLLFAQKEIEVQKKILGMRVEKAKLIRLKYESGMESNGNALLAEAQAESDAVSVRQAERQLVITQRALLEAIGLEGNPQVKAGGDISVPAFALDEARVNRALAASPGIVSAGKTLESAKERARSARYSAYPTLKASQFYGWSDDSESGLDKSWSLGVKLNIPLFGGGPTTYFDDLSAAKRSLAAAEENYKARKISLAASLRSGYDRYLGDAEAAKANVSMLRATEECYKEAQIKYMAGKLSFIDLDGKEQAFVTSDLGQLKLARAAHSSKLALEQLLGVGVEE